MIESAVVEPEDRGVIRVIMTNGVSYRFHAFWLRDNVIDKDTRAFVGGQRMVTLADIPEDINISQVHVDRENNKLELVFSPEGKSACFCGDWLEAQAYDRPIPKKQPLISASYTLWDKTTPPALPVSFEDLSNSDMALLTWLRDFERLGYARIEKGPLESAALFQVVALFGEVRTTNYGRLFDVKVSPDPSNLAFTNQGLQAHTDNPYRNPRPSVQVLYCLENSAKGGESVLVDGFAAATRLKNEDPDAFALLTKHPVRFEYKSPKDAVHLEAWGPMIELAADGSLASVRFNSRSIAPISRVSFSQMPSFYEAYRKFSQIIDTPDMGLSFKLAPGECVVMDNTRVLHSRLAYSGAGRRWLQGCYSDLDGIYSTLEVLRSKAEHV